MAQDTWRTHSTKKHSNGSLASRNVLEQQLIERRGLVLDSCRLRRVNAGPSSVLLCHTAIRSLRLICMGFASCGAAQFYDVSACNR